ncbi:hypothetical protein CPB97_004962, partial [Podila verticillata]
MIGFFVNTLALRIDLSGEPRTEQLLERIRETTVAAQAHQDLPFEQVVEIAQPPRRMDQTPLFQVLFAWQNNDMGAVQLQDVEAVDEDIQYDIAKFDLDLHMGEVQGEVVGGLMYSTALFDHQTIVRHIGYLEAMLRWMTVSTEQAIGEAPILGSSELELLTQKWNMTDRPYPDNTCVHHLFESQVKLSPEAIAIVHDDRTLTYRELNSRATGIAHQLVAADVKPGDNVLILLNRSIDLVAAQIAILKVGAAYVPIDTKAPVDRQAYITSDCGAKLLITDENTDVPVQVKTSLLRLSANQKNSGDVRDLLDSSLRSSASSLDTAYIMYTSGSTGVPKGVMVHHRGIARLVINNGFVELGPGDRMGFATNPSFDPSTHQVWGPLLNGACIVIIDNDTYLDPHRLAKALVHHQVTCLYMTHGLLHQYASIIGDTLSKLKYLLGGAEQGAIKAYLSVLQHGGPVRLVNRYGPTETTVSATAYTATSAIDQLERLPIGRPISNTRVYVLDKHLNPVPMGVVGEIYIGGAGVTNGYLNRPDLTAERYLPDPFFKGSGARMYKSGDQARYLSDGNLVFMGRNDDQVKIRGHRIELGEIEARLREHDLIKQAFVTTFGDEGEKSLVAYVVSTLQENMAQTSREHLAATLPEYMIPSAFVRLDTMPLTNNGKIDRRALPKPDSASFVTQDYVAPQGDVE